MEAFSCLPEICPISSLSSWVYNKGYKHEGIYLVGIEIDQYIGHHQKKLLTNS